DVVADSLRLTLARIAEAAAGARDRADDVTLGERHPRDPPVPLHRAVGEVLEVVGRPLAAPREAPGAALRAADRAVAVAVGPAAQPVLAHDAEAPAVPPFAALRGDVQLVALDENGVARLDDLGGEVVGVAVRGRDQRALAVAEGAAAPPADVRLGEHEQLVRRRVPPDHVGAAEARVRPGAQA